MQYITCGKHLNSLFKEFEKLYTYTSDIEHATTLLPSSYSLCFKPLIDLFNKHSKSSYNVNYKRTEYKHIVPKKSKLTNNGRIILCYSGGKDSTATAIRLKNEGWDIILYHLRGINQTYKDEYKTAEKVAELLNIPIIIENISLKGKHDWTEHPMKNMIVANHAIQWGIDNDFTTNICFGNFTTSSLYSDSFEICGGDCREMWEVYEGIIQQIIPKFHMHFVLSSFQDTVDIIRQNKELLPFVQSCIGPYRYREYLHTKNENRYGVKLLPHRCGSCWKCCLEYCMFEDNPNNEFYNHCIDILSKTLKQETGIKHTRNEVLQHYMLI